MIPYFPKTYEIKLNPAPLQYVKHPVIRNYMTDNKSITNKFDRHKKLFEQRREEAELEPPSMSINLSMLTNKNGGLPPLDPETLTTLEDNFNKFLRTAKCAHLVKGTKKEKGNRLTLVSSDPKQP